MADLKAGDRVRITHDDYAHEANVGDVLTIASVSTKDTRINFTNGGFCHTNSTTHWERAILGLEDLQEGDFVVDGYGNEREVIGRAGQVVFIDDGDDDYCYGDYSIRQLKENGYKVKEEGTAREMTVAEVEELVGGKVKIVKEEE